MRAGAGVGRCHLGVWLSGWRSGALLGLQSGFRLVGAVLAHWQLLASSGICTESLDQLHVELLGRHVRLGDGQVTSTSHEVLGIPEAVFVSLGKDEIHLLQTTSLCLGEEAEDDGNEGQVEHGKDDVGLVCDARERWWGNHDDQEIEQPV